ncbi:hypothetical protein SK128_004806, partial [Halocaridina rubra]
RSTHRGILATDECVCSDSAILPYNGGMAESEHTYVRIGKELITDGDLSSYALMSFFPGPYKNGDGYILCSRYEGVRGRYISIQRATSGTTQLMLLDVRVYALVQ